MTESMAFGISELVFFYILVGKEFFCKKRKYQIVCNYQTKIKIPCHLNVCNNHLI